MRLVFVHGINQNGKDPDALKAGWIADLEAGIGRPGALAGVPIEMPFYGDVLVDAMARMPSGAIAQGPNAADNQDLAVFLAAGLAEQAVAAGIPSSKIAAAQTSAAAEGPVQAVAQGFPMSRRINAIVRLLEEISPWRGDLVVRLLTQAHHYLKKPHVAAAVDACVQPALAGNEPLVLVTHSLGTVVSFKLLRALAAANTPVNVALYVTCGSPLSLATVQGALGPPFAVPAGVARWINLRDPDDLISLDRGLGPPLFASSIENRRDFENGGADAHAIPGYLADGPLAGAIAATLGL